MLLLISRGGEGWAVLAELLMLVLAQDQVPLVADLWLLSLHVPALPPQGCKSMVVGTP